MRTNPLPVQMCEARATVGGGAAAHPSPVVSPQIGPIANLATRTLICGWAGSAGQAYWVAPVVNAGEKE